MVLALALAGASVALGMNWQKQARAASAQLPALGAQLEQARTAQTDLQQRLKPGTPAVALEQALDSFLSELTSQAATHQVGLQAIPAKEAAVKDTPDDSGLVNARVTVSGRFAAYPELVTYLQQLQRGPAALVKLTVEGDSFEASFKVFGLEG